MTVQLPSFPSPRSAVPRYLDYSVRLDGGLAADGPRIGRIGNRWALDVSMLMPLEPRRGWPVGARVWLARLRLARREGALLKWYPQRLRIGAPGAPVVDGLLAANVAVVPIVGARPGYVFREGQFFNLVDANGRHYLHSTTEEVVVAVDGSASIPIDPLTRAEIADGLALRMDPVIEGQITGDDHSWDQDPSEIIPISFSIEEFGVYEEPLA